MRVGKILRYHGKLYITSHGKDFENHFEFQGGRANCEVRYGIRNNSITYGSAAHDMLNPRPRVAVRPQHGSRLGNEFCLTSFVDHSATPAPITLSLITFCTAYIGYATYRCRHNRAQMVQR
jgi:hypothetical protein